MFAFATNAGDGGKTRFSCSTVSMFTPCRLLLGVCPYVTFCSPLCHARKNEIPPRSRRAAAAAEPDFRQPLAAAAAVPGPDRRPGRVRVALLAGALLPD